MPEDTEYMHPYEVAALFSVSPKTVSRWAKTGKLPFRTTLGGHRRFPAEAIRQLAATNKADQWAGEDLP